MDWGGEEFADDLMELGACLWPVVKGTVGMVELVRKLPPKTVLDSSCMHPHI